MATNDPLTAWGISHGSQKGWHTYYSLVTFGPNKTPDKFLDHVKNAHASLSTHVSAGRLRIKLVSITFGIADAVIVWQAKDDDAAKAFRDAVLAGNGHHSNTVYAMSSGTHG